DSVAQRGLADLRARIPREARLLSSDRTRIFLAVLCVLSVWGGQSFAAVAEYLGRPVASVHLTIEGRDTADPMLTGVVATAAGEPLSMAQVRSSVSHLFGLGRFEDVQVDATLEGGRVVLRYDLIPIHPVARMRFVFAAGAASVDERAL